MCADREKIRKATYGLASGHKQQPVFLSEALPRAIRDFSLRGGEQTGFVVAVAMRCAVLLVKEAFRILRLCWREYFFDEWMRDQWKLYGSSDHNFSDTLRKSIFKRFWMECLLIG